MRNRRFSKPLTLPSPRGRLRRKKTSRNLGFRKHLLQWDSLSTSCLQTIRFYIDAIEIMNAIFSLCLMLFYAIDTYNDGMPQTLIVIEYILLIYFSLDYLLFFYISENRLLYIFSSQSFISYITIIPTFIYQVKFYSK